TTDLQCLFESFEALGERRKRYAERLVLTLVPGRADTEKRATAGQHVERRRDLRQQSGMPVGHAGDDEPEVDALRLAGEEAQRGVALEHRVARRLEMLHLEPVVHQAERRAAGVFRSSG